MHLVFLPYLLPVKFSIVTHSIIKENLIPEIYSIFDGEISKVGKIPKSGIVSIKADENRKNIVDDKKSTKRKKEHGKTKSKKFKR